MNKPLLERLRTPEGVQEFMCEVILELCDETYPPKYGNERLKTMIVGAKALADMLSDSRPKMTDEEIVDLFRTRFADRIKQRDSEPSATGSH